MLQSLVDSFAGIALVLDDAAHPIHTNAAAQSLLADGRLLRRDNAGALVAANPEDDRRLRTLIGTSARGATAGVKIGDNQNSEPHLLWAIPTGPAKADQNARDRSTTPPGSHTLLLIVPAEPAFHIPRDAIALTFDLSAAESRVVAELVAGKSTTAIATAVNATPKTVRNQLSMIYAKLGVESRAELVALVMRRLAVVALWSPITLR